MTLRISAVVVTLLVFLLATRAARAAAMHRGGASQWRQVIRAHRHHAPVASRVVRFALRLRGVPYVWGGTSPHGFDCSGFVRYVFGSVGVHLPRTTWAMMGVGHRISARSVRVGDALFFSGGGHVALAIGHGLMVHAPHSGTVVSISPIRWFGLYEARRFAH